jgi:[acyl-carrier-protein] S-malonyltransferase
MSDSIKTALLCSGQGSQYVGMLKDINDKYPEAKKLIDHADDILGYKISDICFEGPVETLKETRYTQPALFLHSSVVLQLVKSKLKFDACAGHSVGEYAALFAAGVLSFDDALKLVSLRGELMFKAGEIEPGTMYAIINLPDEKVEQLCKELTEAGNGNIIVPANYNSPGQIVISGSQQYLRDNAPKFKEAGARMVSELQVSGAFHSPLLRHAKDELEKAINNITFNDAQTPVYSNVFAAPLVKGSEIKEALVLQLMSPVKWSQTMFKMKEDDFSRFIELGPGNVLQGLAKRSLTDVEISGIDKSEDVEKLLA